MIGNVSPIAVNDDEAAWKEDFDTYMMDCVRQVNDSMPWLEVSDTASITLLNSVLGRDIYFAGPAYGAFKTALVHYAKRLAYKPTHKGIWAKTVSPETDFLKARYGSTSKLKTPNCSPPPSRNTRWAGWRSSKKPQEMSSFWPAPRQAFQQHQFCDRGCADQVHPALVE